MKKKLVSIVLAGALLLSLSVGASAASVTAGVTQDDGTITVSGAVTNAVAGQQVTVLVVKEGTDLDELVSSDVAYIDQVSASGDYSVSFEMPEGMTSGAYDVYVGGTEVTTLATTDFTLGGSLTLSGSGITTSANGANLTKIWIRVYQPGTTTLVAETYLKADGTFSMLVPSGTYDIKVGREGYLTKNYKNVVINADDNATVSSFELFAGDIDQDGSINMSDWSSFMTEYGKAVLDASPSDFDDDQNVNMSDWSALMNKYGKRY